MLFLAVDAHYRFVSTHYTNALHTRKTNLSKYQYYDDTVGADGFTQLNRN